ncbi:MAG: glycosyltransferase family 39 protein [Firmicutes bacterium]|nr:glycosyltransferase family 39 protein [Bacillota bacterium]
MTNFNRAADFLKKPANIFVLLFIAFFSISNFIYIQKDTLFTGNDGQSLRALRLYKTITTGQEQPKGMFEESYPPLMPLLSSPFIRFFGNNSQTNVNEASENSFSKEINYFNRVDKALRYSLIPYWVVFLLAMYGIGKHLGDKYSGIAVMCLAASSPHILNLSRHYYLDFPQTAVTALALYFLYKSDRFSKLSGTILFALLFSAACWIKWSAAFFLTAPFIWIALPGLFRVIRKKPVLMTVMIFIVIQIAAFILWVKNSFENPCIPASGNSWILSYLLRIILPGALGFILLHFFKTKSSQSPEEKTIFETIRNIYTATTILTVTVLPFYFAKIDAVRERYTSEMVIDTFARNPHQNLLSSAYSLATMFSFSLILMAIGFIIMFLFFRDRLFDRFLPVVAITAGTIIMIKIGHSAPRYFVTFAIFAASLGGYWIFCLKKFRIAAVLPFIAIAILSLTGLTFTPPQDNKIFMTVNTESGPDFSNPIPTALYSSIKPRSEVYNLGNTISEASAQFNTLSASGYRQIFLVAHPSYHIPFINDSYDDELRRLNIIFEFITMLEPAEEIQNRIDSISQGQKAVFIVVFDNEQTAQARIGEIRKAAEKISVSDKIINFGQGLQAKIVTAE